MTKRTRTLVALVALGLAAPVSAPAGVQPGTWLDQSTSSQAQGLLPAELLGLYERGEWKHQVIEPKPGTLLVDPTWVAASKENEGKFKLTEEGSIRRADDGKEPDHIYGAPFPNIDRKDSQAATKLVWNWFYNYWATGNTLSSVQLSWVSRDGLDREAATTVSQRFWDGQKPHRIPSENPMNFLFQQLTTTDSPTDLQGISALAWRYRDTRHDSSWSYVPALRRVRQVNPANRADGFLGSDMSQDDGGYFDAKPEEFTWKMTGEGEQLFLVDRAAVVDNVENFQSLPDGGWRSIYAPGPRFNYQKPDFDAAKDLAWAPVSDRFVLVKRPVWILEGSPKDPYYLYGKVVLRLDKEDFNGLGSSTSKYDWQGNLLISYTAAVRGSYHKEGDDYLNYSSSSFSMAQNWKQGRATVAWFKDGKPSDQLIEFRPRQFEMDVLAHGK